MKMKHLNKKRTVEWWRWWRDWGDARTIAIILVVESDVKLVVGDVFRLNETIAGNDKNKKLK